MSKHITKACNAAFFHLHIIRRIKKYLSRDCLLTLVHVFVTNRLDYCNSLLYGLPKVQIAKLQMGPKRGSKTYNEPREVFQYISSLNDATRYAQLLQEKPL